MWEYHETSAIESFTVTSSSRSSDSRTFVATASVSHEVPVIPTYATFNDFSQSAGGESAAGTFWRGEFTHTRSSAIGTTTQTSTLSVDISIETRRTRTASAFDSGGTTQSTGTTGQTNTRVSSFSDSGESWQAQTAGSTYNTFRAVGTSPGGSLISTASSASSSFVTSNTVISQMVSRGGTTVSGAGTTTNGTTFTLTVAVTHTSTYNVTTQSSALTVTATVTTTATRQSTYPVSGTTTGATQSTSSVDSYTTSTTQTATSSGTVLSTLAYTFPILRNTIAEAESTDWPWIVTTTGANNVTVNGDSFTKTTFTNAQTVGTVSIDIRTITAGVNVIPVGSLTLSIAQFTGASTVTQTLPSFSQVTTISTTLTTTNSTYNVGGPTSAAASFSLSNTTRTATINYTTTRTTSFSFTRTTTRSSSFTIRSFANWSETTTSESSFNSTNANGPVPTTVTFTSVAAATSVSSVGKSSSGENRSSSGSGTSTVGTATFTTSITTTGGVSAGNDPGMTIESATGVRTYAEHSSSVAPTPTRTDITIGPGFQIWPDIGRGFGYGTNLNAGFSLVIPGMAHAFVTNPQTPILDAGTSAVAIAGLSMTTRWETSDSKAYITYQTGTTTSTATAGISTVGAVPSTLRNTQAGTSFGGFGWNSTAATTLTGTRGIHRATLVDSSSFTTTELSWEVASSYALSSGQAIAMEPIPIASSRASFTANAKYLNWTRFPVT